MKPTETLLELRLALARATDDLERAGLHDAIAIRLSESQRFEEALEECSRAVGLRERLALDRPEMIGLLAISLANQGGHLTKLRRYDDAIAAHASALELLLNMKTPDSDIVARIGYNAERIAILLWERREPGLAARFDGVALGAYASLAKHDQRYASRVQGQLFALSLSLGRAAANSVVAQGVSTIEVPKLTRLSSPSLAAAGRLSQWAQTLFDDGDVNQALSVAQRTISYCALFKDQETVASISAQNRHRLTEWSGTSRADNESAAKGISGSVDRRLWCCTGRQLSYLIGDLLARGFASTDVHTLGRELRVNGFYLARDFAFRCEPRVPEVFITYTWADNYVDLQVAVRSALNYLATLIFEARPALHPSDVERLVNEKLGVWIDFIFIDQSARNLAEEVREIVPRVLASADVHFVLSDSAILRSWCCYELALFNLRFQSESALERGLRSFIGRSQNQHYELFFHTSTTQPEDKIAIEEFIGTSFPGGMYAFDALMMQVSMLSDSFVSKNFTQPGAAIDQVRLSLDKWLAL